MTHATKGPSAPAGCTIPAMTEPGRHNAGIAVALVVGGVLLTLVILAVVIGLLFVPIAAG